MRKLFGPAATLALIALSSVANSQNGQPNPNSGSIVNPAVGTWQRTTNRITASSGLPLLLTDGTVMVHNALTRDWYKLTPDAFGSYQNGTWSQIASLPTGYGPLYYGTAVMRDGRVVLCGGEYNLNGTVVYSNKCAIYNPLTNTWANLNPPSGWANIGDTQLTVMPDGKVIIAELNDTRMASLDPVTLTWTQLNGANKPTKHHEEGWTLLPDGSMLTVNTFNAPNAQKYVPSLDAWFSAGTPPQLLVDAGSHEIGPAILLPNGTVLCTGATGHNAIYHPGPLATDPGSWTSAPDFPVIGGQLDIADGPGCLMPNGNVLLATSPGIYNSPTHFFEYDGTSMLVAPSNPHANSNPSYVGNMLLLPTGQVLYTDLTNDVEIYTPTGGPQDAWRPTISLCPTNINQSMSFVLSGTQLNGLSENSGYGDDSTNATNYPLVRIKNNATGHVKYCRTRDHSIMAVATGNANVSTNVDVPATMEIGASTLEVVTNGIPSIPKNVYVTAPNVVLPTNYSLVRGLLGGGSLTDLYYADSALLNVKLGFVLNPTEAPVQVQGISNSPVLSPTSFQFTLVANLNTIGTTQKIYCYNYLTSAYELLDSRAGTTAMQSVTVTAAGNLSRFVNQGSGEVKTLVTYNQTGPVTNPNWSANLDRFNWIIQ